MPFFLTNRRNETTGRDHITQMGRTMKVFDYQGLNIRYLEAGEGPPLIMLHGFGASSYTWRDLVGPLAGEYRVIALDLKGFGLSDRPKDDHYSIADQAEIVAAFIKAKGLEDVVLVGNSLGGGVALMTCFKLNQGLDGPVKRLILIGSASYKQRLPYFIKGVSMPVFNALSHWLLPPRTSSWLVLRFCYYDGKKINDEQVRVYAAYMGLPGSRYSLMKTAQQIIPSNVKELNGLFQTISIPVLVLWGEEDKVISVKLGRRLAEEIPGARLVVFPKCGHMPQEESPQATLDLVKDFLHEN